MIARLGERSRTDRSGEENKMASNKAMIPEAKEALERFKMEAANEVGVNLKQGYNGDLTAREVGSVGGQMVKIISPEQQWIFTRNSVRNTGHCIEITYAVRLSV